MSTSFCNGWSLLTQEAEGLLDTELPPDEEDEELGLLGERPEIFDISLLKRTDKNLVGHECSFPRRQARVVAASGLSSRSFAR